MAKGRMWPSITRHAGRARLATRRRHIRAVGEIDGELVTPRERENTRQHDQLCSWVTRIAVQDRLGAARQTSLVWSVATRAEKPQSTSSFVSPASTISALPLDCRCPAMQNASLQLVVEQTKDLLRRFGLIDATFERQSTWTVDLTTRLVLDEDTDTASVRLASWNFDLKMIQASRGSLPPSSRCRFPDPHSERNTDPCERSRSSTVKADPVERQPNTPPGAVERLLDLERTARRQLPARHLGTLEGLLLCCLHGSRIGALLLAAEANHQAAQHFRFQFRIGGTRLPLGLILAFGDVRSRTSRDD
jgi:hypothetical protein